MKRPPTLKQLQEEVSTWNTNYQVGQSVTVEKDNGEIVATNTTSAAYILGFHTAVIHVEGIAGCYLLSRVRAKGSV